MLRYSKYAPSTFIIMASLLSVFTVSSIEANESAGQIFNPDDKQLVKIGKEIYADNCASCHGANLEGQTPNWRSPGPDGKLPAPPHDQTGHTWHHTDALLFNLTKYGLAKAAGLKNYGSNMPIYEDILTDEEIVAVLSFIKSTWPKEIIERHDQMNAAQAGTN
ncbi:MULTISPECIES: c-type cytochrome [unclassified Lentilitoribacter]|uniref:c-type cytochrome n=1 Tax=unclassified Lentilitoribacter TaxID=2647570 RepID=UPI0018D8D992|nr:cytochrome c [Lentilitoribacter sp. Alg239-R112]